MTVCAAYQIDAGIGQGCAVGLGQHRFCSFQRAFRRINTCFDRAMLALGAIIARLGSLDEGMGKPPPELEER